MKKKIGKKYESKKGKNELLALKLLLRFIKWKKERERKSKEKEQREKKRAKGRKREKDRKII